MCKSPEQVGEELLRRNLGIDLTYMQVQKQFEKKVTCNISYPCFFPAQIPVRQGCSAYLVRAEHLSVSAGWCIHKYMNISAIGD